MRLVRGLLLALVLAPVACAQEVDDEVLGGGDEERRAYVDAIALSAGQDDSTLPLDDDSATCFGEAYVDVLGVDALREKVTPEEIRAEPDKDHSDWGVVITTDQGVELFRRFLDCEPDAMDDIAEGMADEIAGDPNFPLDLDADCLAEVDPSLVEGFMGAIIAGGGSDPDVSEEAVESLFLWIEECTDLQGAMLDAMAEEAGMTDEERDCIEDGIDEATIRDLFVLGFMAEMSGDTSDEVFEDSPAGHDLMRVLAECATPGFGEA